MDQWAEEKIPKENKKKEVRANGQVKFKPSEIKTEMQKVKNRT